MKTSFLDYYKMILEKVSFDRQLLAKEYRKALNMLHTHEAQQLDQWMKDKGLQINSTINNSMYQATRVRA
ncbi:hypothetical protein OKW21_004290 [Catalinimonas alkaloidigena]|uniref:hypothetical protein n=1 Tax=Catalinimonas alkaloidigena TaxID=1075417 RepID=UPI0024061C76|nr:hypothetical protein [Catalinimonas alkaloidigena]MDF9799027.1 hypothetical protein [Catalinimonas alkaloidigena]